MENGADFNIRIMRLENPVSVVGVEVRVKHGTPECFPAINALCANLITEGTRSKIQNRIEPMIRFGMCIDHVYYGGLSEGKGNNYPGSGYLPPNPL